MWASSLLCIVTPLVFAAVALYVSLTLPLSGEALNNAGGLADLCEPQALRKAGGPGGDRLKEGQRCLQCGGW